jgi:hypothetical protein
VRWLGLLAFVAGLALSFGSSGMFGVRTDLVVQAIPPALLTYASTIGTMLIWLGAGLFVLGLRRRNRVDPDVPPAPSKWGRGG